MKGYGKRTVILDYPEFIPGGYKVRFKEFRPTRKVDGLPTPKIVTWGGSPVLVIYYNTLLANGEDGPSGNVRLLEGGLPLLVKAFSGDPAVLPDIINADATPELLLAVQDHLVAKGGEATAVVTKHSGFLSYLAEAFPPEGEYILWYKEVIGRAGAEVLMWDEDKWGPRVWFRLVIAAGSWVGTVVRSRWSYILEVDEDTLEVTLPYKSDGNPTKNNLRFQVPLNLFGQSDEFDVAECGDVYNLLPEIVENIESTPQKPVLGTVKPGGFVDLLSLKRPGAGVTITPDIPSPLTKTKPKSKKRKTAEPAEQPEPSEGLKPETKGVQQDEESKLAFAQSQFRKVIETQVKEWCAKEYPDKLEADVRVWPSEDSEEPWRFPDGSEGQKWAVDILVPVVEMLKLGKVIAAREDNPGWTAHDIARVLFALGEPAKSAGSLLDAFLKSGAETPPKEVKNDFG